MKLLIPNQSMIQPGEGSADSMVLKRSNNNNLPIHIYFIAKKTTGLFEFK